MNINRTGRNAFGFYEACVLHTIGIPLVYRTSGVSAWAPANVVVEIMHDLKLHPNTYGIYRFRINTKRRV